MQRFCLSFGSERHDAVFWPRLSAVALRGFRGGLAAIVGSERIDGRCGSGRMQRRGVILEIEVGNSKRGDYLPKRKSLSKCSELAPCAGGRQSWHEIELSESRFSAFWLIRFGKFYFVPDASEEGLFRIRKVRNRAISRQLGERGLGKLENVPMLGAHGERDISRTLWGAGRPGCQSDAIGGRGD